MKSSVLSMVGGIFLVVGLLFGAAFVPAVVRDRLLLQDGTPVVATVVAKHAYRSRSREGGQRAHQIEYEFPLPDGRVWSAARDISRDRWNRLRQGDRIEVRYDPRDPDRNLLPRIHEGLALLIAAIFPGLFVVLGGVLVRFGLRDVLMPLRLYRVGAGAIGRVLGFEEVLSQTLNGRHPVRIHYTFSDHTGAEREGAMQTADRPLLARLEHGTPVTVLYDPRDPRRSTLLDAMPIAAEQRAKKHAINLSQEVSV